MNTAEANQGTSQQKALELFDQYDIWSELPENVIRILRQHGANEEYPVRTIHGDLWFREELLRRTRYELCELTTSTLHLESARLRQRYQQAFANLKQNGKQARFVTVNHHSAFLEDQQDQLPKTVKVARAISDSPSLRPFLVANEDLAYEGFPSGKNWRDEHMRGQVRIGDIWAGWEQRHFDGIWFDLTGEEADWQKERRIKQERWESRLATIRRIGRILTFRWR